MAPTDSLDDTALAAFFTKPAKTSDEQPPTSSRTRSKKPVRKLALAEEQLTASLYAEISGDVESVSTRKRVSSRSRGKTAGSKGAMDITVAGAMEDLPCNEVSSDGGAASKGTMKVAARRHSKDGPTEVSPTKNKSSGNSCSGPDAKAAAPSLIEKHIRNGRQNDHVPEPVEGGHAKVQISKNAKSPTLNSTNHACQDRFRRSNFIWDQLAEEADSDSDIDQFTSKGKAEKPEEAKEVEVTEDMDCHKISTRLSSNGVKEPLGKFADSDEDEDDLVLDLWAHLCSSCGAARTLPFDLGDDFICRDAGLSCNDEQCSTSGGLDEFELYTNTCAWCHQERKLPFDLGQDFVCKDAGLECQSTIGEPGNAFANVCTHCCAKRMLPFDFGEDFCCEDACLVCDYSRTALESIAEDGETPARELFINVCAECGRPRRLPFDLRASFVCQDAGFQCERQTEGEQEEYVNVCERCGETRLAPWDLGEDYVCAMSGHHCVEINIPTNPDGEEEVPQKSPEDLRTQLLWEVMIKGLSAPDAAQYFTARGFQPPFQEELDTLRTATHQKYIKKVMATRAFQKSALKSKNKNANRRYLNNELVTVAKGKNYLTEEKESAADKAKTSVELYIYGIGRGGRHAVKLKKEENIKKKGPSSNKVH